MTVEQITPETFDFMVTLTQIYKWNWEDEFDYPRVKQSYTQRGDDDARVYLVAQ